MKRIKIWSDNPSDKQLREISAALKAGEIIIYPTDTLYAIGCDALNVKAIDRICSLKGINPAKSHLSIICADISMAAEYCRIDNKGFRILKEYTPGPFTFLFPTLSTLPKAFKGRKTVGIRIPEGKTAREIAAALGNPLLSTSIEFDENDYAINADLIAENYENNADIFLDAGDGDVIPSTIVDMTSSEPEIIREGKGEFNI